MQPAQSTEQKPLPPMFKDNDFYYYKAQTPYGINFIGNGLDYQEKDAGKSAIPMPVTEETDGSLTVLREQIRAKVQAFFDKQDALAKQRKQTASQTVYQISSDQAPITFNIVDNAEKVHTYTVNNDHKNQLALHQANDKTYYGSVDIQTAGLSKTVDGKPVDIDPTDNIDIFASKISAMAFQLYPNYGNQPTLGPTLSAGSVNQVYKPYDIDKLTDKIYEYYHELQRNKTKAEEYQKSAMPNDASESQYQQAVEDYQREYMRIFNISVGILFAAACLYQLNRK